MTDKSIVRAIVQWHTRETFGERDLERPIDILDALKRLNLATDEELRVWIDEERERIEARYEERRQEQQAAIEAYEARCRGTIKRLKRET